MPEARRYVEGIKPRTDELDSLGRGKARAALERNQRVMRQHLSALALSVQVVLL